MEIQKIEGKKQLSEVLLIHQDIESQKKLAELLLDCVAVQKSYKAPEQMEGVNRMFQLMLGGYSYEKVKEAFFKYMEFNAEMPTPSDILAILDRVKRNIGL